MCAKLLPAAVIFLFACNSAPLCESECGSEAAPNESALPEQESSRPAERRTPRAVGQLPEAKTAAPLRLNVSNQSFDMDPVDIDVYVDGVKLVSGDFLVEGQHTRVRFDFDVEANEPHTIRTVTKKGSVEESAVVDVPVAGKWVVVSFWYDASEVGGPVPPSFSIHAMDEEPGVD